MGLARLAFDDERYQRFVLSRSAIRESHPFPREPSRLAHPGDPDDFPSRPPPRALGTNDRLYGFQGQRLESRPLPRKSRDLDETSIGRMSSREPEPAAPCYGQDLPRQPVDPYRKAVLDGLNRRSLRRGAPSLLG